MKNFLTLLVVLLVLSDAVLAQMELKLSNDIEQQSLSQILESNSQLIVPSSVISPPDAIELKKGLIMLGFLADASFPMEAIVDLLTLQELDFLVMLFCLIYFLLLFYSLCEPDI